MNKFKFTTKNWIAAGILFFFTLIRVAFPHISIQEFALTSAGALMIFSGAVFQNKTISIVLSMLMLLISDVLINAIHYKGNFYYDGMPVVYTTLLTMAIVSSFIMKKATINNVILSTILITLIHWIFTSVAYWATGNINVVTGTPLERTFSDLVIAHTQAIPFELSLLSGTALFSAAMFGIYYFITKEKEQFSLLKVK